MKKELQVVLGFNCNFSCNHCLNNSRPGNNKFDIKSDDIQTIIRDIGNDPNISIVSFSGGEPLLYLNEISKIIHSIRALKNRNVSFSITTNGSLLERYANEIKDLGMEFCTISFDYAHKEYIDELTLTKRIEIAKNIFSKIEINFVYTNLSEISLIKNVALQTAVKVTFNKQIQSGRSVKSLAQDEAASEFQCPNINNKDFIKVTYIPSYGYSICCGPVVFDKLVSTEEAFTHDIAKVESTQLFMFLKNSEKIHKEISNLPACNQCRNLVNRKNLKLVRK